MNLEEKFSQIKVLIVGDVMLDRYWWGRVERISPEAPVPVVYLEKTSHAAGGAANVASNVINLGAAEVYLVGVLGKDEEGRLLRETLERQGIKSCFLIEDDRKTTVKTRIIAHNQHVVRVDRESISGLSDEEEKNIAEQIEKIIDPVDVVVLSDYAKGLLSFSLTRWVIELARRNCKKILVDPKGRDFSKYKDATIITPNRKEAFEACPESDIRKCARRLLESLSVECVVITLGEEGMVVFEKNGEFTHLPALARQVYDVTGAGDTVIATLALGIGCGLDYVTAARIANVAAGAVVEEVGTSVITKKKLFERIL
ncbi:MAG: D-glycero-beta-D-manno-heptose-7-phosphate kinase [Pyrinomonadaceae bacterium]|nr:D-glycero-beta-D-manno-heptose-7-phosphate kinase [Pyrinomonadaceae bacterium]MCX7640658.1 D-glycero-beta-D-manno-heptose-7-phosphate kinase [Pyrinomonadaceae bacterium]MDW8305065.1 D-glycero-beta-D-manno-heptose-7-phosphate kinase [Acidobacteriota bacterium]